MSIFHRTHHDEPTHEVDTDAGRHADFDADARAEARMTAWDEQAYDRFGGVNVGAAFFGWLVAIALTVLLGGIVGAVASAIGDNADTSWSDLGREAGSVGLASAIALTVVLLIGYFAGGYVAGRMSRYDGGRQGQAVWLIGLLVTLLATATGWVFGSQYDVLDRIDLPDVDINLSGDTATIGGIVTGIVILLVTLLAAIAGGKAGARYHDKVDRARHIS